MLDLRSTVVLLAWLLPTQGRETSLVGTVTSDFIFARFTPRGTLPRPKESRRGLQTSTLDLVATFQTFGEHFIDLSVGTPPQSRTLAVDTASYVTAFPCTGCNNCGTPVLFQINQSSSFGNVSCSSCFTGLCNATTTCQLGELYSDGSTWTGYEANDQCFLSNDFPSSATLFELQFFCQQTLTGSLNSTTIDGIMGMGFATTSFWWQMYLARQIQNPTFSVCYAASQSLDFADKFPNGTFPDNGVLTLGGSDSRLHSSSMVYTSNATVQDVDFFFHVDIRQVYLGMSPANAIPIFINATDAFLNPPPYGTIVDSGAAVPTFPQTWYTALNDAWMKTTGVFFDPYLAFGAGELSAANSIYPTLYFQLVGDEGNANIGTTDGLAASFDTDHPFDVIIPFPPSRYIQLLGDPVGNGTMAYGPNFLFSDDNSTVQTVLGESFIAGHDVYFDWPNARIGWAESDCSYSRVAAPTVTPSASPTLKPSAAPTNKPSAAPTHKSKKAKPKRHVPPPKRVIPVPKPLP